MNKLGQFAMLAIIDGKRSNDPKTYKFYAFKMREEAEICALYYMRNWNADQIAILQRDELNMDDYDGIVETLYNFCFVLRRSSAIVDPELLAQFYVVQKAWILPDGGEEQTLDDPTIGEWETGEELPDFWGIFNHFKTMEAAR